MKIIKTAWLLLLTLPAAAFADDDCFCLKQGEDVKYRGCWKQQKGPAERIFHCRDTDDNVHELTDLTGLTRLTGGEVGCDPCVQAKPIDTGEGPIRGDDDKKAEPTGAADDQSR